jgi:hypothetical protein
VDLDKGRLAKLLKLTGSDHDAEALNAVRKANDLLRQCGANWDIALGLARPAVEEPAAPTAASAPPQRPAPPPPPPHRPPPRPVSYQPIRDYRNAFRREPLLPRLLAFPFWIVVELLAIVRPQKSLNTRGLMLSTIFTLSMMLGILAWIGAGYYVVVR